MVIDRRVIQAAAKQGVQICRGRADCRTRDNGQGTAHVHQFNSRDSKYRE